MSLKEESLALSSGMGLAAAAVSYILWDSKESFWINKEGDNLPFQAFNQFKDEIIKSIFKPDKVTALHYYLYFFQDVEAEVYDEYDEERFKVIFEILGEIDMIPDLPIPDFENCDCQKEGSIYNDPKGDLICKCGFLLSEWTDYVTENCKEINQLIVHGAFQYLFQDRNFLHKFHIVLARWIEKQINYIEENYSDYLVLVKKRFRRHRFPIWLKQAVFYRDKGTCVLCRIDLSNLIRTVNKIHIDHIVPLELYGTNDASNMQLLCSTCNTSKGARSTKTSNLHAPYWNLDKDMFGVDSIPKTTSYMFR